MSKSKSKSQNYPEIDEIREDLDSLKGNVVELTKHIKKDGVDHAEEAKALAKKRFASAKLRGQQEVKKLENQVREKPAQSMAVAFAGGVLASMLIRGRR